MSFEGDFSKLRRALKELDAAAGGKLMPPVTRAAKAETFEQYQKDFANQEDPSGNAWAPTQTGKTPVNYITGTLANPQITASNGTVTVVPVRYWVFANRKARGAPARPVLPFGSSLWDDPIEAVIRLEVDEFFSSAD